MRAAIVAVLFLLATAGARDVAAQAEDPIGDEPAPTGRETPMPARAGTRCVSSDAPGMGRCFRTAPGVRSVGTMDVRNCRPEVVVIDCGEAIAAKNTKKIAEQLGWAKATPEQRRAIAWTMARVVRGDEIVDAGDAHLGTTDPAARERGKTLVLDYWTHTINRRDDEYRHEQLTFAPSGTYTATTLRVLHRGAD